MTKKENQSAQRRLRNSFLTSVISIAMVLFLLGLVGFLVLNARQIGIYVKENIGFNVELNNDLKDADMQQLKKLIDAKTYVRSSEYISKEAAAVETQQALGEDFLKELGYNPLPATVIIKLKAEYANPDSIFNIENELSEYEGISDIYYRKTLVHEINDNVRKISLILGAFSILLLLISVSLINNTIRLSVYSKRFLIHSMQLVGATRGFIRRPFLFSGVLQGFLGSLIGVVFIIGSIYLAQDQIDDVLQIMDLKLLGILFLGVLLTGIIISYISSFFAVNKYLNLSKDELYFR
ncbi:MAG: permease-like cell division protein FtsX [Bacteroidales bacterium]|nr:permease-like cell division protein FtsX [Bacteroidales bacterium]